MSRALSIILLLVVSIASGQEAIMIETPSGEHFGVYKGPNGYVGPIDKFTIIPLDDPPPPTPTSKGQIICIRPWSCTLDESDADLTIRESIDDASSTVPYLSILPGTLDQRMQPHSTLEAYRNLVPDKTKAYAFHVAPVGGRNAIIHQGPLDADTVLGWIGVPRVNYLAQAQASNEEQWLDVDFQTVNPELCGVLPPTRAMLNALAGLTNVSTLPGFKPIPKNEWAAWTARFPMSRLVMSIRNVTNQVGGSCVGHSCGNNMEGGEYTQAGDLFFRKMSMQSMYTRIGRSPGSGAYVGDAVTEIFEKGILPLQGEVDIDGNPYPHTHPDGSFYTKLPSGWEATAKAWRAAVYLATTDEDAFRVLMDCRVRINIARSSHSISEFAVTSSGKWAYENSWGTGWGDFGISVGYDSRRYGDYVYHPVVRDEINVLALPVFSEYSRGIADRQVREAERVLERAQEAWGMDSNPKPAAQTTRQKTWQITGYKREGLFRSKPVYGWK